MIKVAILVEDIFEDNELYYPYFRLQEEGFQVDLIGTEKDVVYKSKHGMPAVSNLASKDAFADDYDAVVIPGGYSPDYMRRCSDTVRFVRDMNEQKKPVAAICHGPWMMISGCDLEGCTLTGFYSIKDDIINAGAKYVDEEVVVDGNLITSRSPKDLPAFAKAIIKSINKSGTGSK